MPSSGPTTFDCMDFSPILFFIINVFFAMIDIPYGVQFNYPLSALLAKGYSVCYNASYSTPTTANNLAMCAKGGVSFFVGAMSKSSISYFTLGSFGTPGIFKLTNLTTTAYLDYDGSYWYYYIQPSGENSFGFSSSSVISLASCDTITQTYCSSRLCWNVNPNAGGYRAGCNLALSTNAYWRKVILKKSISQSTGTKLIITSYLTQYFSIPVNSYVQFCFGD